MGEVKGVDGVLGPLKLLLLAAAVLGVVTLFGWLFVVSYLGVPWRLGFPLSLLFGLAMIAWSVGGRWRLLSAGLWAAGAVWVVAWFVGSYL